MDPSPEVSEALAVIGSSNGDVFLEHRDSLTLRLDSGGLESRSDRDIGAGVRYGSGVPLAYASTNLLTADGLMSTAQVAASAAGVVVGREQTLVAAPHIEPAHRPTLPVDTVEIATKVETIRRIAEAARAVDPRIRSVSVTYVEVVQQVLVVATGRAPMQDLRTRTRVTCRVVARDDNRQASGFDGPGVGGGFELFDEYPPELIGAEAGRRAILNLTGIDFATSTGPVVLGPSAGGMLVHEMCGHGLEGDLMARNTTVFARSRGQRIAESAVTIIDDPSRSGGFGSYGMDDEGTPSRPTVLIENGVQVAMLTDGATATKLETPRTANGRRESYAHPALCRMSNTYLDQGTESAAGIVGSVDRGVYVARLSGGEVDTATGDFTFTASEAYEIDGGQIGRSLRGITLLGNSFQALETIGAVGDDLAFTEALCGKDGQWVPISYGSPTVGIGALTITGSRA
jgi:TldD protein